MHVVYVVCRIHHVQNILSSHCPLNIRCVLCAPVDEGCPIMVSHCFPSIGGYACLAVMQTTVGEPRFALAVQGCLVFCVCHTMTECARL